MDPLLSLFMVDCAPFSSQPQDVFFFQSFEAYYLISMLLFSFTYNSSLKRIPSHIKISLQVMSRSTSSDLQVLFLCWLVSNIQTLMLTLFQVLAESNPEKRGWCLRNSNEIFMIFNLIIQHHYLSNYGKYFLVYKCKHCSC